MSPREVQTICLLSLSFLNQEQTFSPQDVTYFFAYHLANSLIKDELKRLFKSQFSEPKDMSLGMQYPQSDKPYLHTLSRKPNRFMLLQFLNLRLLRQRLDKAHPIHQLPGLGGIVLEGDSGIGKSELLCTLGQETESIQYISVSMDQQEKEIRLYDAFHQGKIVIIDEINSSPMMEQLLNALLMGKTPDGESAKQAGFLLIGTQNPISFPGRRPPSQALARRLFKLDIQAYPESEIIEILQFKGLNATDAQQLSMAFHRQSLFAKSHHLQPAPNFRDVIRCAEQHLKSLETAGPKH